MLNLSPNQRQIVEAELVNPIQVLASAGSGKTRVLTERVRYILEQTKKDGVIALTFTNKAAEEMMARLSDCGQVEERVWVATVHSVAQRILEKYGHTVGLPSELHIYDRDKDRMEVFLQSLRDDGVDIDEYLNIEDTKERRSRENNLQSYMDIFSRIKRELMTELEVVESYPNSNIWKIYQDYQSSLINSCGIDYDDILVYAHRILLTHDWIANIYRSRYQHVCVDEAQDLNSLQYQFVRALCGEAIRSVFMVGDPDQMIYGFNGSSKTYLCSQFLQDFSPLQFTLNENYRSTKAVIRAANKLKPGSQKELDYALEGEFKIVGFDNEKEEADQIVTKIQSLLTLAKHDEIEGEITLDKMVIIARNRFVFKSLEKSLASADIPFSLRKGERQMEPTTKFGRVLDYSIRVKLNPSDWVDGKKLCEVLGLKAQENWSQGVLQKLADGVREQQTEYSDLFSTLLEQVDTLDAESPNIAKFINHFKDFLTNTAESTNWTTDEEAEGIRLSLEELDEFGRNWTTFRLKGLGDSLAAFRNALALGQVSENTLAEGLTLSTVHTMKGLEKDIVFVTGMCEGVFPDYRAHSEQDLEEERNSAFVAVTRAKRWLYMTYPKRRMMPWGDIRLQRKSRFLTEME